MNIYFDCINFMPYALYRHLLKKWSILDQKSNSLGIEHKKLGNSTEKGRGRIKKMKKCTKKLENKKSLTALTRRSII